MPSDPAPCSGLRVFTCLDEANLALTKMVEAIATVGFGEMWWRPRYFHIRSCDVESVLCSYYPTPSFILACHGLLVVSPLDWGMEILGFGDFQQSPGVCCALPLLAALLPSNRHVPCIYNGNPYEISISWKLLLIGFQCYFRLFRTLYSGSKIRWDDWDDKALFEAVKKPLKA